MSDPISKGQRRPDSRSAAPDGRPFREQPKWRQDFPIDSGQDEYVSRRELIKFMVLTSGAFVVGQAWLVWRRFRGKPAVDLPGIPVATVDELAIGGAKTFHYPEGSTPRILVRTGESSFVAYDQQCTHLLCPVVPAVNPELSVAEGTNALHCPCHNGWFDLQTGNPTAGPPRRPLPKVTLEVRDRTVFATGIEGSHEESTKS